MEFMKVKTETIKDYNERINMVLLYINNHLEDKLTLEALSSVSNFSTFHFHRIMRAHLGESIGAYILRIRLNTAAQLLRFSNEPVQDIAFKVGYDTPSSFNKAFRKRFDISPLEFRSKQAELQPDLNITQLSFQTMEKFKLKPKIVELKEKKVIFIQSIGKYGDNKTSDTWNKLMDYIKKNKLFGWRMEFFGISHDDPNITETDKCRYDACVTVSKEIKPDGEIGFKLIDGGKYAVFRYKGPYTDFGKVYETIFRQWLPQSDYELRNIPSLEKYLNDPKKTKPEKLITEIYIPVN
jgi:AraC family transcriptional regulator